MGVVGFEWYLDVVWVVGLRYILMVVRISYFIGRDFGLFGRR